MQNYLIKDVQVVNEGVIRNADVLLRNGRIENIGSHLSIEGKGTEINGSGKFLLPGVIDDQVHFRPRSPTNCWKKSTTSRHKRRWPTIRFTWARLTITWMTCYGQMKSGTGCAASKSSWVPLPATCWWIITLPWIIFSAAANY
jgi:cytosine/adenosine deaminase-related metal-dependent hydrolase